MKRLLLTGITTAALALTPVLAHSAVAGTATSSAKAAADSDGTYVPVAPTRLLDTRATGKIAPGGTRKVQIAGSAGIPSSGVSAAVINLTVTGPTRPGYLSAYPGTTFPGTSSVNFAAGETRANLVTVPVADDGSITVLNGTGAGTAATHAIVDVQGYYLEGSDATATAAADSTPARFYPENPERLLDTRDFDDPLPAQEAFFLDLEGGPVDTADVTALAINLTAVGATGPGYLTAWDGTDAPPNASSLNLARGQITPNNVVVPVELYEDETGSYVEFGVFNGSAGGSTHVIIDIVGTYAQGLEGLVFRPLSAPIRMVDTRSGKGATKFTAGATRSITPSADVLNPAQPSQTGALVGNLTAVGPSAATYLTVWPGGERPGVSNLNPARGQTVANHGYIGLGDSEGSAFSVFNNAGTTDVLIDVNGRFDYPTSLAASRRAQADHREDTPLKVVRTTRHGVR